MGIVYKINFPNGDIYYGSTTQTLLTRIKQHLNCDGSGVETKKSNLIKRYGVDVILDFTEVIYKGELYKEMEGYFIDNNGDDTLNKICPSYNRIKCESEL